MREETPKEATQATKVTAGANSTLRVELAQDLVLTQSPMAEVVDSAAKKAPVAPSSLGQFPLASAGFLELYRQLGTAYEVKFHSPTCMLAVVPEARGVFVGNGSSLFV